LELAHSLDTDSCINALRRFIARRGKPETIRTDNGTNFVGSERELNKEIQRWDIDQINEFMIQRHIQWEFNPPSASHFGGVWERLIRSVRKVLYSVMHEQNIHLSDEGLVTLFCEVESILNGRPITYHPLSCFYFALSIFDVPVELVSIPSAILTKINQLDIEFASIFV
jgi:transposase InsO family protein